MIKMSHNKGTLSGSIATDLWLSFSRPEEHIQCVPRRGHRLLKNTIRLDYCARDCLMTGLRLRVAHEKEKEEEAGQAR